MRAPSEHACSSARALEGAKRMQEASGLLAWRSAQVIELPIKHPELFESLGVAQPKASRQHSQNATAPMQIVHILMCMAQKKAVHASTGGIDMGCKRRALRASYRVHIDIL